MGQNEHTPTAYEIISWKIYGWECRGIISFFLFFWCKQFVWDLNGLENWMRVPATELLLNKCESVCGVGTHLVFIEMFADSVLFSYSLLFVWIVTRAPVVLTNNFPIRLLQLIRMELRQCPICLFLSFKIRLGKYYF